MAETAILPFFVYGTLLRGEPNHFHFRKAIIRASAAVLTGATLWNLGPYPMALRGEGEIHGELFEVAAEPYARILPVLDRLEGVNGRAPEIPGGLFHRARCLVTSDGASVEAWVYFGREDLARRGKLIESGDWKKRKLGQGTP